MRENRPDCNGGTPWLSDVFPEGLSITLAAFLIQGVGDLEEIVQPLLAHLAVFRRLTQGAARFVAVGAVAEAAVPGPFGELPVAVQ